MAYDLTFTLTPNPTAVPLQNVTLSVSPSASFTASSYLYQWKLAGSNVVGAIAPSYKFDANPSTGHYTYLCSVSALSSNGTLMYTENTGNIVVTVVADVSIFSRHLPKGYNALNESGKERFTRLRSLGYV